MGVARRAVLSIPIGRTAAAVYNNIINENVSERVVWTEGATTTEIVLKKVSSSPPTDGGGAGERFIRDNYYL